jgi:glycosyltransferase involved in cell wall biosynthesis
VTPLVSICVPAYNAGRWIRSALESAFAQTYPSFEVVVSDNASSDDTLEIVQSFADERLQVFRASHTVSAVANQNRVLRSSRGAYLKFLHADDALRPTCVEKMMEAAVQDPTIGLVFAPREVVAEDAPDPEWEEVYRRPHLGFHQLEPVNDGHVLFNQLLDSGFAANWVGEPSAVLLSREALEMVGLMNERLHQIGDLELWARIMLSHRVGFVDEVLSVYRHHDASQTVANARTGQDWFDLPWLVEGLLASSHLTPAERVKLRLLRRAALRQVARSQVGRILRGDPTTELPRYLAYRARAAARRPADLAPPLHGRP